MHACVKISANLNVFFGWVGYWYFCLIVFTLVVLLKGMKMSTTASRKIYGIFLKLVHHLWPLYCIIIMQRYAYWQQVIKVRRNVHYLKQYSYDLEMLHIFIATFVRRYASCIIFIVIYIIFFIVIYIYTSNNKWMV